MNYKIDAYNKQLDDFEQTDAFKRLNSEEHEVWRITLKWNREQAMKRMI